MKTSVIIDARLISATTDFSFNHLLTKALAEGWELYGEHQVNHAVITGKAGAGSVLTTYSQMVVFRQIKDDQFTLPGIE